MTDQFSLPFRGFIEVDLELTILGCPIVRRARIKYAYRPYWQYLDWDTGELTAGEMVMALGLDFLTEPKEEGQAYSYTPDAPIEPQWVDLNGLFEVGGMSKPVINQIETMVDQKARAQDLKNRGRLKKCCGYKKSPKHGKNSGVDNTPDQAL